MRLGKAETIVFLLVASYHRNECQIENRGQRNPLSSVYHCLCLSCLIEEMLPSSISVLHPLFFPVKQCSQFNRTKKERRYGINKSSYKGHSQWMIMHNFLMVIHRLRQEASPLAAELPMFLKIFWVEQPWWEYIILTLTIHSQRFMDI